MPAPTINTNSVISFMTDGFWAGGASLVLTYSVGGTNWASYGPGEEPTDPNYSLLSTAQANLFTWAMETWDNYVEAQFNKTTAPGAIRVAFTGIDDVGVWGYAYLPSPFGQSAASRNFTGDIWIDVDQVGGDFTPGTYNYLALLHEIGHALGLDHSFNEGGEPSSEGLPAQYDNTRYSIMSYTQIEDYYYNYFTATGGGGVNAFSDFVHPITPMLFDILVAQDLYGASTTMNAGATAYTFDPNQAVLRTIYDASGIDTWNLSSHTRSSNIDLRAGSFSSIAIFTIEAQIEYWVGLMGEGNRTYITNWIDDPAYPAFTFTNNVAIAYGVTIENVIAGSAADTIIGNSAANNLQGKSGGDILNGLGGNDTLNGGFNADKLIGGVGIDTLIGGTGADVFVLNAPLSAANRDVIQDFAPGADRIQLENNVFAGIGANGPLAANRFVANATGVATDNQDRIVYNTANGALFFDADGNGSGLKIQIATLTGAPTISAADFQII